MQKSIGSHVHLADREFSPHFRSAHLRDEDAEKTRQFADTDSIEILESDHFSPDVAGERRRTRPVATNVPVLRIDVRQSIEEIHDAGLQGVFGTNDHESGLLDELFDDVRAVPQMLHRRADIRADRRLTQGAKIVSEFRRQQAFDGRSDQIDDGVQIARLILDRTPQLLQCRFDGAALSVAQHHHQARPELLCSKFHAADQGGSNYVAGHANDEKIAETLIEDDLDRYP